MLHFADMAFVTTNSKVRGGNAAENMPIRESEIRRNRRESFADPLGVYAYFDDYLRILMTLRDSRSLVARARRALSTFERATLHFKKSQCQVR